MISCPLILSALLSTITSIALSSAIFLSALSVSAATPPSGVPQGCNPSVLDDAYWAVWNDAEQSRIDADIERHRKADGIFAVPDADGTEVTVEQLSHDFRFGAHGFFIDTFPTREANRRYEENFCRLFNQVTIPFYWRTFERHPGDPHFHLRPGDLDGTGNSADGTVHTAYRQAADRFLSFAKSHGLRVHGHPLCWGDEQYMLPFWLYQQFCPEPEKRFLRFPLRNPDDLREEHCGADWDNAYKARNRQIFRNCTDEEIAANCPAYLAALSFHTQRRIAEILDFCSDRVDSWDVVNESSEDWANAGRTCETAAPLTRSIYGIAPPNYALEAFRTAARHASKHPFLAINDWRVDSPDYPAQIADLAAHGARIDLVGAQFHLFQDADLLNLVNGGDYRGVATPSGIRELFARLGVGGRPVHLSEITIPAPGCTASGKDQQAIVAYNLYRAWFSQPNAWGITWWHTADWWRDGSCGDRPEGGCENGSAGVIDADGNLKPVYRALDELINHRWKTRLAARVTNGHVSFRGFRGSYRLSWKCSKCGKPHERFVDLAGNGVRETSPQTPIFDCEIPIKSFTVDGKPVTLGANEDKIDLTKLYPNEVMRGTVGTRWAEIACTLTAPADGDYTYLVFNDWFGEYSANGGAPVAANGPSDFTRALTLTLRKGENRLVYRTRAGSSGKWLFGLYHR